jgi:hypothetical protein
LGARDMRSELARQSVMCQRFGFHAASLIAHMQGAAVCA